MTDLTPQEASEAAAHKAKSAQMAVEVSREVHLQEAMEKTAEQTKEAVMAGFREVFGKGDLESDKMVVLFSRIPILCTKVEKMHEDLGEIKAKQETATNDIADIKGNIKWGVRLVVGSVLVALLGTIIKVVIPSLPL